jgi:serine/threonine protein kinase
VARLIGRTSIRWIELPTIHSESGLRWAAEMHTYDAASGQRFSTFFYTSTHDSDRTLGYAAQINDGRDHAHCNRILHRDLKPENLMFTGEGRLKITDFGLARLEDGPTVTMEEGIRGTLTHMAPECLTGITSDRRADI